MFETLLSILIPSLKIRQEQRNALLDKLFFQCHKEQMCLVVPLSEESETVGLIKFVFDKVEVITAIDDKKVTTGEKRNMLMSEAIGKYTIFLDDDDSIPDYYVEELLKAAESDADCFGMTGIMFTNGTDEKKWIICLGCPYIARRDESGKEEYVRFPNHITGVKREIANKFPFPEISQGEDFAYASAMNAAGVLKTEYKIERHPMYIYDFKSVK